MFGLLDSSKVGNQKDCDTPLVVQFFFINHSFIWSFVAEGGSVSVVSYYERENCLYRYMEMKYEFPTTKTSSM